MKKPAVLLLLHLLLFYSKSPAQQGAQPASWSQDFPPFRIAGNLYYVGTAELSSYLITTPQGHILINTGLAGSDTMIRRHVESLGFRFTDIRILLTNQAHFDHVGAMAAIRKATGARLMVEERDAPLLADGGSSDCTMGGKGPLFEPVKVDRLLHNGDDIEWGGMAVTVLHHPGHTKGACSYLFTVKDQQRSYRVLIANMPTILSEMTFPDMPCYPGIWRDFAHTLDTMPRIQFDIFLAGHVSQCDLQKKYLPGYHPGAFFDREGYLASLKELKEDYLKKTGAAKPAK